MQQKAFSLILLLLCMLYATNADYNYALNFYPANTTLAMGDSITISWAGDCSIEYATGCYDWLSVYPATACVAGQQGANTCYMTNNWVWVDNLPKKANKDKTEDKSTWQSGNWTYQFLAPGQYQFRIVRCSCGNCEPITDDMLTCPFYPTVTVSSIITVNTIFNGLNELSESQQVVMGFLWWILTSNRVPNANGIIQDLIDATNPNNYSSNRRVAINGGSCVSDVVDLIESFETAAQAFDQLYYQFSMSELQTCFADVITVLKGIYPVLSDCNIAQWTGDSFIADVAAIISDLIPGLEEVEDIIEIAIEGHDIYIETVNFFSSLNANEYFAAGVYFGRFVDTVIPLIINGGSASNATQSMN